MAKTRNIFASVAGLTLAVLPSFGAAAPPAMQGQVAPRAGFVHGWIGVEPARFKYAACSAIYMKFVGANTQYTHAFGNAATGKCYYKFATAPLKGPVTEAIYMKGTVVSSGWNAPHRVVVRPAERISLNF